MKSLKFLGLAALVAVVVSTSAFSTRFAGNYFEYVGAQNFTARHTIANYNELTSTPVAIAGAVNLAWIFVDASNVYNTTPKRPKVDLSSTTIYNRIEDAIAAQLDKSYTSPTEQVELKF